MTWIVSTDSNQGRASQLLFSKTMKPSIKRTYHSHLQKEGHGHTEVPTDREIQRDRESERQTGNRHSKDCRVRDTMDTHAQIETCYCERQIIVLSLPKI